MVDNFAKTAAIIRDSGGEVIGRTRLQKITYLLMITGLEDGFSFVYKHYGPFSHELASAAKIGSLLGILTECEKPTSWGGTYSVYSVDGEPDVAGSLIRTELAQLAAAANAVELELAATAIFLSKEGYADPWGETERRKPEKASFASINGAKSLLQDIYSLDVPTSLPDIVNAP